MTLTAIWRKQKLLSMIFLVYVGLAVLMPQTAIRALQSSLYYVFEMLMIMPVIFVLTSLIEAWVPKDAIINGFGHKAGLRGNLLAFLLGSFSAGPIYAAFPVCKLLLRKGASIMNIVIVLSTWAVVKVPMLANEAKFLGLDFMLLRWGLTTISIFLMGYIVSRRVKESDFPVDKRASSATDLTIVSEYCMGCGLCAKMEPGVFTMVDSKAQIVPNNCNSVRHAEIANIVAKCPAKAIICDDDRNTSV